MIKNLKLIKYQNDLNAGKQNILDLILICSSISYLSYLIFFYYSKLIWSLNTDVPSVELMPEMQYLITDRDGIEGYALYLLMFLIIVTSYFISVFISDLKNKTIALLVFFILLIISSIYFINIEFNPPSASLNSKGIDYLLLSSIIIMPLFFIVLNDKLPKILFWIILILFLIPICFITTSPISLFDYSFILTPALRILDGIPISEIYFQYDLLLSLLAALWIKLKIDINQFQIIGQISYFLFFIGVLVFSKHFFKNKKLAVFLLFSLITIRYYSIDADPIAYLQITPIRLDLWLLSLMLSYYKGIYHWTIGLFLGFLLVVHKNFALIYLISYYEVIFALFLFDFFQLKNSKNLNLKSLKLTVKNHIVFIIKNCLIIVIFFAISLILFKGFIPESAILYQKLGIGMMRISPNSFYWYMPILFSLVFVLLVKHKKNISPKYFASGLFIISLAIGNSIYFFGRSHEHNILNISGLLILSIFLFFDLLSHERFTITINILKRNYNLANFSILPIIFILGASYFYSGGISKKIEIQFNNFQNSQKIYPINRPNQKLFDSIKKITNNSKNVYFIYKNDFEFYYYGNYSPQGYYSPCVSWVEKTKFIHFLQELLDKNYYIVTSYSLEIQNLFSKLNYNKTETIEGFTVIKKKI